MASTQVELKCSKHECELLQEQLHLQREKAASSFNQMQKQYQDKAAQQSTKIRELSDKLKEVCDLPQFCQIEEVTRETNFFLMKDVCSYGGWSFHDSELALSWMDQPP